jgi:hypothetical protein
VRYVEGIVHADERDLFQVETWSYQPSVSEKKTRGEGLKKHTRNIRRSRIEGLEQRRRRVTAIIGLTNLINLVFAIIRRTNSGKCSICSQLQHSFHTTSLTQIMNNQVRWQLMPDGDPVSQPLHARHRERCVGKAGQSRKRSINPEKFFLGGPTKLNACSIMSSKDKRRDDETHSRMRALITLACDGFSGRCTGTGTRGRGRISPSLRSATVAFSFWHRLRLHS